MEIGFEGLIIIILIIIGVYFVHDYYTNEGLILVKSDIDNQEYKVQANIETLDDANDAKAAANLMAEVRQRLEKLQSHLNKVWGGNDERVQMLNKNFRPDRFQEGRNDIPGVTSYSVNKGEKIVLCTRNKNNKLVDINTIMYVSLHECAHLINKTVGHDTSFWVRFRELLEEAINIGIYVKQDFAENPVEYCNMTINSSPLD